MILATALVLASCSAVELRGPADTTVARIDPATRAARIETTGCGLAPDRVGSGVAVADGIVLTVAHLVARSGSVTVSIAGADLESAAVVAIDLIRDLALLRVAPNDVAPIELSVLVPEDEGQIVDAAVSGTVPFRVDDAVRITTEEILGDDQHRRVGYRLDAVTTTGDSGAGAYDISGRLAGIVFATSVDDPTTWATGSLEIEPFLDAHRDDTEPITCDPEMSRLVIP